MLDDETKAALVRELNYVIGCDIANTASAIDAENKLVLRRNHLQSCINIANEKVPSKLLAAIERAEKSSEKIKRLQVKSEEYKKKVREFLVKSEPLHKELSQRFDHIKRLEDISAYLKSLENIEDINRRLKACTDDEQAVLLYGQLQEMCSAHTEGHRALYILENTRYWHNILKERLSKQYEESLMAMKWPHGTGQEPYSPPREVLSHFTNLTKYLLLLQEPKKMNSGDSECETSLPVRILLRPFKKRFAFHFTGARQTARIDRPEWFLTQTLTWIRDHKTFVGNNIQPIAEKLEITGIRAEEEFTTGLVSLAAERLHTVLGMYNAQAEESLDVDAAFAHAVDEALGFHRELAALSGQHINTVLSVLTRAETFVRWLAVEKKYALSKMDETLGSEQWMDAVAAGVECATGALLWVPRGADWFITLLHTIEDRYTMLPQPGHRLQFLELQLELIEEWRVRLTQLLSAARGSLAARSLLTPDAALRALAAVVNAAHHTGAALLQWAHSLHYLQLHYYRRQFEHFTELQHSEPAEVESSPAGVLTSVPGGRTGSASSSTRYLMLEGEHVEPNCVDETEDVDGTISLIEVEVRAKDLALDEVKRQDSLPLLDTSSTIPASPDCESDAGVFGALPKLLARLRDAGLSSLADHVLLEFKAGLRDYKQHKWHAMPIVEERALSVSTSLCRPLAELCARLHSARDKLAPSLYANVKARVAAEVDVYLFEEVVLENWWNSGGTAQFTHDVRRNLVPVFAPQDKPVARNLPRLCEACTILNMDYDDALRLRSALTSRSPQEQVLQDVDVFHIVAREVLQILNQRTDLNDNRSSVAHHNVMDIF